MIRALWGAVALVSALVQPAGAQEPYPTWPITIVVAFPPGGLADLTARPVALALKRLLKQPVVVANSQGQRAPSGTSSWRRASPTVTRC